MKPTFDSVPCDQPPPGPPASLVRPLSDASPDPSDWSLHRRMQAVRGGELSCAELLEATFARIDACNATLNALVSLQDRDPLREAAAQADADLRQGLDRGPLHGMAQAVKDLAPVAGLTTTMGSTLFKQHVPTVDAIFVERMRRSGALFVGRSNTPEFGFGSHTYNALFGITRNAFDPERSAGGSSGGAAVALATGMLAVADGSDMMGSLRNPAGWNGVIGMRPSTGLIPNGPAPDLYLQQLGTAGPMARTVRDLAWLMSVMAGPDPRDPLSRADADTTGASFAALAQGRWPLDDAHAAGTPGAASLERLASVRGLRIGWLGDLGGHLAMEDGVIDACVAALRRLESAGARIEPIDLDFDCAALWDCWCVMRALTVSGGLLPLCRSPSARAQLKPEALWEAERAAVTTVEQVARASATRTAFYHHWRRLLDRVDVLVSPTAQCFPFDAHTHWPRTLGGRAMDTYHRWMEVVIPATLTGSPALALPISAQRPTAAVAGIAQAPLAQRTGLMGLQWIGAPGSDLQLMARAMGELPQLLIG